MEEKLRTIANFLKDISLLSTWKDEDIEQLFSDTLFFLLGTTQANVPEDCKFDQVMRVLARTSGAARYIRLLDRVAPSLKYQKGFDFQEHDIPLCCSFNNLNNARALIDADSETIRWSSEGSTPMQNAMLASYDAFCLLVDHGCESHLAPMNEKHPLFFAMKRKLDTRIVVDILRAKPSLSIELLQLNCNPVNVYTWMVKHGTTEDVLALHELGCVGFEPREFSLEPLAMAIIVQNEELVEFFLQFMTEVTTRAHPHDDFCSPSFLHLAAKTRNTRIFYAVWAVEHLRRPLFERRYSDIKFPFTVAAKHKFNEACLLFLHSGWIPQSTDILCVLDIPNAGDIIECMVKLDNTNLNRCTIRFNCTIFVVCALLHRFENADRLVSLGAKINSTPISTIDRQRKVSPLKLAVQQDNIEALEYFLRTGISLGSEKKVNNLVRTAIFRQLPSAVHLLYNAGAGRNTVGEAHDLITRSNSFPTSSPAALYAAIHRGYRFEKASESTSAPHFIHCTRGNIENINPQAKVVLACIGATTLLSEDEIVDIRYECFFSVSLVHRLLWSIGEHQSSYRVFKPQHKLFPRKRR